MTDENILSFENKGFGEKIVKNSFAPFFHSKSILQNLDDGLDKKKSMQCNFATMFAFNNQSMARKNNRNEGLKKLIKIWEKKIFNGPFLIIIRVNIYLSYK
ncbi:hypothetical protein DERP_011990 [Dermatophagoides pteronyssinus]|uniref:Uncharacterized protein n=1 Tax=Dermatophagoides pteronyssinus TaxID=6956 RepID=A0ABQ8IVL7_DERPT|nr:hypothetical protein DERP_011990 [Dermatophagoides pteronyssinus]